MSVPDLDKGQQRVMDCVLRDIDGGKPAVSIGGYAGTGKSVLVSHLLEKLSNWACCTYTGKAADVLRRKGCSSARTIHSTIYTPYKNRFGQLKFKLKDEVDYNGFVIDEASMVGGWEDRDLRSFEKPVIYVGDHGQLPPVKGNIQVMLNPDYRLEVLHRNAGEIAHFCEHIRKGKNPRDFRAEKRVKFITDRQVTPENMLKVDQVLCVRNNQRVETNKQIREYLGYQSRFDPECFVKKGDRVICLRNNKDDGVFNGMQGVVTGLGGTKANPTLDMMVRGEHQYTGLDYDPTIFHTPKPDIDDYEPGDPNWFDFSYAITVWKSQGDQFKSGIYLWEPCHWTPQVKLDYTACSRFSHYVYFRLPK